jgi:hypothetical protein
VLLDWDRLLLGTRYSDDGEVKEPTARPWAILYSSSGPSRSGARLASETTSAWMLLFSTACVRRDRRVAVLRPLPCGAQGSNADVCSTHEAKDTLVVAH